MRIAEVLLRRRAHAAGICAVAILASSCDPGPPPPQVRKVRVKRLSGGTSARPWPLVIEGKGMETSRRHPLRFQLVRQKPLWPRVRVSLRDVRLTTPGVATAQVPAGIPPGRYGLVALRGTRERKLRQQLAVQNPRANVGYPVIHDVFTRKAAAGEGGMIVISGANLADPVLVTLHGPQRRRARRAPDDGERGAAPRPVYRRLPIVELPVRSATPTRLLALRPGDMSPGRYYMQVYTSSHRGHQPDAVFDVAPRRGSSGGIWGLALVLLLFTTSLVTGLVFAAPRRGQRARLLMLAALAAVCLGPLALLA